MKTTTQAPADDPLLLPAADWIAGLRAEGDPVLLYPISRLQRRFRIGYNHTLRLMDALERRGDWIIAYHDDGTRYARLDTKGPA